MNGGHVCVGLDPGGGPANELIQSNSVVVAVHHEVRVPAAMTTDATQPKIVMLKLILPVPKQARSATMINIELTNQPRQIRTLLRRNSKSCTRFCALADV